MITKYHDRANQTIANFYKVCPLRHPFQLLFAYYKGYYFLKNNNKSDEQAHSS